MPKVNYFSYFMILEMPWVIWLMLFITMLYTQKKVIGIGITKAGGLIMELIFYNSTAVCFYIVFYGVVIYFIFYKNDYYELTSELVTLGTGFSISIPFYSKIFKAIKSFHLKSINDAASADGNEKNSAKGM